MIDGKNFFDQRINSYLKTYENLRKIATDQADDNKLVVCQIVLILKMIAIDLSKQQVLDADSRVIQQINFAANLDRAGNTKMFFIIGKQKKLFLNFHKEL